MKIPLHLFFKNLFAGYGLDDEKDPIKRGEIIERIIKDLKAIPKEKQKIDFPKFIEDIKKAYAKNLE